MITFTSPKSFLILLVSVCDFSILCKSFCRYCISIYCIVIVINIFLLISLENNCAIYPLYLHAKYKMYIALVQI